jgi:hypothetical protein
LYATTDLEYALQYSGACGCLTIFDWEDDVPELRRKDLEGNEWEDTVKGHVCSERWNRPPVSLRAGYDILWGAVSENHQEVLTCSQPVPSETFQCMGKREACPAFERKLVAIVYLFT